MVKQHASFILVSAMGLGLLVAIVLPSLPVSAKANSGIDNGVAHRVATLEAAVAQLQGKDAEQKAAIAKLTVDLAAETAARQEADDLLEVALADLSAAVDALEEKTQDMSRLIDPNTEQTTLRFTGVNVQVVDGTGYTDGPVNGTGNLIVGYNELRGGVTDVRTGSHNLILGRYNNYSSLGGMVAGTINEIGNEYATVSGGAFNIANGNSASVSGGVSNRATGIVASVSGGNDNTASGLYATVTGGIHNQASGDYSSVSGGQQRSATGRFNWVAGGLSQTN